MALCNLLMAAADLAFLTVSLRPCRSFTFSLRAQITPRQVTGRRDAAPGRPGVADSGEASRLGQRRRGAATTSPNRETDAAHGTGFQRACGHRRKRRSPAISSCCACSQKSRRPAGSNCRRYVEQFFPVPGNSIRGRPPRRTNKVRVENGEWRSVFLCPARHNGVHYLVDLRPERESEDWHRTKEEREKGEHRKQKSRAIGACYCLISKSYFRFSSAAFCREAGSSRRIHSIIETGRLPFAIKSSWNFPIRKFSPCLSL